MGKTLVVGSSDIDIFATPKNESTYSHASHSIAFDLGVKVPVEIKAMTMGGNGANVSVGMKKLGIDVAFYTYLGTDVLSKQIEQELEEGGIEVIEDVKRGEKTSLSYILDLKDDRIIFSHHENREYGFDTSKLSGFDSMYVTSIGVDWKEAYLKISQYAAGNNMQLAFSPGSPQLADINKIVLDMVEKSTLLFVNKEEGEKILQAGGESASNVQELIQKLLALGPRIVSVTNGHEGAYAGDKDHLFFIAPFMKDKKGEDKTGAGDSYAAAFFSAHLLGIEVSECMIWGAMNSNAVMGKIGAQKGLLTREVIQSMLTSNPDFKAQIL